MAVLAGSLVCGGPCGCMTLDSCSLYHAGLYVDSAVRYSGVCHCFCLGVSCASMSVSIRFDDIIAPPSTLTEKPYTFSP